MNWDKRLEELYKRIPHAPRTEPRVCEALEELERNYGGTRRPNGRLAPVNFAGKVYRLAEYPNPITPQLAEAMLRQAGL
jgi:hypothetical protein